MLIIPLDTPQKQDFEITINPSSLRLFGSPYTLGSPACPTVFFRKQTSRVGVWSTQLSFNPTSAHMEAGTVVYWNHLTYAHIGIKGSSQESRKQVTTHVFINGQAKGHSIGELKTKGDVTLFIWCTDKGYKLGFKPCDEPNEKAIQWMGETIVEEITADPPIGAAFTGMMLGVYATGNGDSGTVPADFSLVEFDTLFKPDPPIDGDQYALKYLIADK